MITGKKAKISLSPGGLEPAVLKIIDQLNDQAQLPVFIDVYIEHSGIDKARFTDEVREAMVEYLLRRGAQIDSIEAAERGDYDELFALAYENAVSRKAGRDDPMDAARQPGGGLAGAGWDFSVELFEEVEQQGVASDNILAAGAIDYIFELGEHMGVFKLVDALVLNWACGSIDVVEGDVVSRMYRYWKLRDERMSAEERGMVYRRVLNKGDADVLDRMVVNEDFPNLWHNLMAEVADYIDKTERSRKRHHRFVAGIALAHLPGHEGPAIQPDRILHRHGAHPGARAVRATAGVRGPAARSGNPRVFWRQPAQESVDGDRDAFEAGIRRQPEHRGDPLARGRRQHHFPLRRRLRRRRRASGRLQPLFAGRRGLHPQLLDGRR